MTTTPTTWGLIVEVTVGLGERKRMEAYVLTHVEGTRDDALAELERRARSYDPEHPRSPKRRRLLRTGEGFLLVLDGAWHSYATRFTIAELLEDSARPAPPPTPDPAPQPTPDPAPEPPPAPGPPHDEDGIPLRPSWLGRPDLS
ncbi:hypothetical protein [Streptomyces sp. NPDC047014]|uniref:hypothetical protein n=1 Tax=Streptomyces sp. NPDC047014 TaxID=3155736 RepID=UPI0033DE9087